MSPPRKSNASHVGVSGEPRPRKSLGQYWLRDRAALRRIVEAAALGPQDVVLEIGPGPGALTELLLEVAGQVVAVELDGRFAAALRDRLGARPNLQVVQGDILKCDIDRLVVPHLQRLGPVARYQVVANLPYYITSAVVRLLLEAPLRPERLVLTVQLEVAQRMVASPPRMSLLSVSVQFYAVPRIVARIPPGSFQPPPKVTSAIVQIDTRAEPAASVSDVQAYFDVVRAGFAHKRKQLRNSLGQELHRPAGEIEAALLEAGVRPQARAETLSVEDWGRVYRALSAQGAIPRRGAQ